VRVQVSPPTAAVTLDGRPFAVDPSGTTARLNVGEHLFAASAPGYTRITRTLTVASGQAQVNVLLELVATSGFLDITAEQGQACFDFLPTRVRLDLDGWADRDIFTHD